MFDTKIQKGVMVVKFGKYGRLRSLILQEYGSFSVFADRLGLSKQTVSNKLCGKVKFNKTDILAWSWLLDIRDEDIPVYFMQE